MGEFNLLDLYPRAKRNLEKRARVSEENRMLARQFGKEYFDGNRDQGYGGYKYDGRWKPIVRRFKAHYGLPGFAGILDVGCGKGFMLNDFHEFMPEAKLAGIDISEYAIANAKDEVSSYLKVGNARELPYPDNSFDLVISINTVHNLPLDGCKQAITEIQRVSCKHAFITMDAWRTDEERERLMKWNLTALTYMHVDEWKQLFDEVGYTSDYYWFIA